MKNINIKRLFPHLLILSVFSHFFSVYSQELRWTQSYQAGYKDQNGLFAGGSEIMHIVSHKGKLFASNGYWCDARWVIPPEGQKQSAQVIRLDSPESQWLVDLDLGKSNGLGLEYMKGNILKSVSFTKDENGKLLDKPVNLLIMAAGAGFERGGAISAWVRNDDSGIWNHSLVRHGVNSGGVRWVPRDMQIYTDKVTGKEQLFLLMGNPGINAGVYDPKLPGKIRWDRNLEFPFLKEGFLQIRPMGIVLANDNLYFSAGTSIYKRIDGERPDYVEVLDLEKENFNEDVDADNGGIRGLTTIENPDGKGDSILLLLAAENNSKSQVIRLDPKKKGGFSVHVETVMKDLFKEKMGVEIGNTLGAHNMMQPFTHPKRGETVHLVGFLGNLRGKNHLKWKGSNLYGGAPYAIRTEDGKYKLNEVNNGFKQGKTVLTSPRTFCLSPFGDNEVYIGGHDSYLRVSDNKAWIFRAPLGVVLGQQSALDSEPSPTPLKPVDRLTEVPVFELRIYTANKDRLKHMIKRFKTYTDKIFKRHNMEPVGYWLPVGGGADRRKFIYILKHSSRYAAYQNWMNFSNDREWKNIVLKTPEFQRLLAEKPEHVFMTENDYSEKVKDSIGEQGGIFELRTYDCNPAKLRLLNERFKNHTTRIFKKHGMKNIAYWTPFDRPESSNQLIYLIHHESREQADKNWKSFIADPEWKGIARESQIDGKFLSKKPERIYLKGLDFSPLK